jgi:importin-4
LGAFFLLFFSIFFGEDLPPFFFLNFVRVCNMADLRTLLAGLLQPDTDAVRQATQGLNQALRDPNALVQLALLLACEPSQETQTQGDPDPAIRQLSAVVLRKRIVGHWPRLPQAEAALIKDCLVRALTGETVHLVRRCTGDAIGALARVLIPSGEWDSLLPLLLEMAATDVSAANGPEHERGALERRDTALETLEYLVENIGDHLKGAFNEIAGQVVASLTIPLDEHSAHADMRGRVIGAALRVCASLVSFLESNEEVHMFIQVFLPPAIQATSAVLGVLQTQDCANHGFQLLEDLLEVPKSAVSLAVPDIMAFALQVIPNQNFELEYRRGALTCAEWIAVHRPKTLVKRGLVGPLLEGVFSMASEPEPDDSAENDDADDEHNATSAHRMGSKFLDVLSRCVSPKAVFPLAMGHISRLLGSQFPGERRAAVIAIGMMAQGFRVQMVDEEILPQIVTALCASLGDSDTRVRFSAAMAMAQAAQHLQPHIVEFYESVIPSLLQPLQENHSGGGAESSDPVLVMSTLQALATFVETLGDKIVPFMEPIMGVLLTYAQPSGSGSGSGSGSLGRETGTTETLQEVATSAIGSAAASCQEAPGLFEAFLPSVMGLVMHGIGHHQKCQQEFRQLALQSKAGPHMLPAKLTVHRAMMQRAMVIEVAGLCASAVSPEAYAPYFESTMGAALEGLASAQEGDELALRYPQSSREQFDELREMTYGFLCHMADLTGPDFAVYLPTVMPYIEASIASEEGVTRVEDADSASQAALAMGIEEDPEVAAAGGAVQIRFGFIDEKAAACHAVGNFARRTLGQFIPFVETSLRLLATQAQYLHEDVRKQVALSLRFICLAVLDAVEQVEGDGAGAGAGVGAEGEDRHPDRQVPDTLSTVVQTAMEILNQMIQADDDLINVRTALSSVRKIFRWMNSFRIVEDSAPQVVPSLCAALSRKTNAQAGAYEEADADLEAYGTQEQEDAGEAFWDEDTRPDAAAVMEASIELVVALVELAPPGLLGQSFNVVTEDEEGNQERMQISYAELLCQALAELSVCPDHIFRSFGVGCVADVCIKLHERGDAACLAPHIGQLLEVSVNAAMNDPEPEVRNNACFALGACTVAGGLAVQAELGTITNVLLQKLSDSGHASIPDNACASLMRIAAVMSAAMPLSDFLPQLCQMMPLQSDVSENETVYKSIMHLVSQALQLNAGEQGFDFGAAAGSGAAAEQLSPFFADMFAAVGRGVLAPAGVFEGTPEGFQQSLLNFLHLVSTSWGEGWLQVAAQLPADVQAGLAASGIATSA